MGPLKVTPRRSLPRVERCSLLGASVSPCQRSQQGARRTQAAERRIISYSVKVHRRYQNIIYVTGRNVGKQIEDCWNVHGEKELTDAWTGFTKFILLNERPPNGFSWSGKRLTRKQKTSRPDDAQPDIWKHMSDAAR